MVEGGGLESRCTGNRTVGSNPTLSATVIFSEFRQFYEFIKNHYPQYSPKNEYYLQQINLLYMYFIISLQVIKV